LFGSRTEWRSDRAVPWLPNFQAKLADFQAIRAGHVLRRGYACFPQPYPPKLLITTEIFRGSQCQRKIVADMIDVHHAHPVGGV
jgi:hypothetical protein